MTNPGSQTPTSAASGSSGATTSGTVSANADGTDLSPEEADAQLSSQTVKPYVTLGNGGGKLPFLEQDAEDSRACQEMPHGSGKRLPRHSCHWENEIIPH
jgi:hypothetical protein